MSDFLVFDPALQDALSGKRGAIPELGYIPEEDDDDSIDVGEVDESNLVEYLSGIAEDLDMGAVDPVARARALQKIRKVSRFAPTSKNAMRALGPVLNVMKSAGGLLAKAKSTAAGYRVTQSMEVLSGPNHKTNIHIENLATATATGLVTVTAPYSGQPFRIIDVNTEARSIATAAISATEVIAVGFGAFNMNGIERVSVGNVTIASGSIGVAKWDFADFSARNPTHPRRKVYPWGTGPTTWLSPDTKIQFSVRNDSGAAINASISLLWQATPCNPRDPSIMSQGLVDPSDHADLFRSVLRFRPFAFKR